MRESQVLRSRKPIEDSGFPEPNPGERNQRRVLAGAQKWVPSSSARAPAPPAWEPPLGRIDLSRLTTAPPLHRPTVTGAGASHPAGHVGGAVHPPADSAIGLSDGTRISFAGVEEIPVLEYA
ncbi:MAG TPA: hypothetical protein VME47_21200 [Acetobacteraceae bacterium]|nr:hypothetical protein [Acetobacteraceae bacterium]